MNTLVVFGGNSTTGITNDAWVLSNANGLGDTPTWTQLVPGGTLPGGRYALSGVGVPGAGRLVIFDGEAGSIYNDVWALQYNQSSATSNGSPNSSNGIFLVESAIGQIAPQTAGYPGAAADLAAAENAVRSAGSAYRYTNYGFGLVTIPAVAWNVIFPGGFNPANGSNYLAGAASTYIAGDIAQADYDLRARLRVNPADSDAAQQLVLLVEDQMLPLEWSGTEAMAYSTYARLLGLTQNGTNVETLDVEQARNYFLGACNIFPQFLANPYNAMLVEGQNSLVSTAVTNQLAQILDDYLRNLAEYADASLTDFQLRSTANFYDPTAQNSQLSQPLLNDIDSTASQIQMMLLLASPFQTNLPIYTVSSAGQIKGILHDMRRLHQSIVLGRITFSAGASGDPTGDPSLNYGEFTTSFVPFFNGLANPGNSSFDVALNLAETFTTYAASQESGASNNVAAVLQRQYDWAFDQQNLQNQYLSQLQNLCGYVTDTNGNTFPDIFTAGLSPDVRDGIIAALSTNALQFNETGTIYQQWQAVQSAETNLLLASIQLSNTFATMVTDQQVANAIYTNQVNLAELILTNGQEISAIDIQEGQVQAAADLEIGDINAEAAKKEGVNNAIAGGINGGISGGSTGFQAGGLYGAIAGAIAGTTLGVAVPLANAYDQAAADENIGSVEANAATQIAALNAQIEQINANEQAQSEYVQANTTMLNLSAQLNSLGLQANSQEVQIQLAAQQVDQERSKLANLMSQVSSLLNQWTRSASLVSQNPEFSSDLLIIRDNTIQQANDAFTLAQQWAFLTALSFNYKDNCPTASSYNFVQRVLATRNTSTLLPILNEMESAETLITAGCQSSPFYTISQFSIRNNSFQANQTQGSGTNTVVTSYEPVLQGGTVLANASASLAAWNNYLASNLVTNEFGERVLVLNFSTSLNAQTAGGLQRNPLFSCDTFGTTLYSGLDGNGNQMHGVQISLVTQGFSFPLGSDAGFNVLLAQSGNSAIRNRGFGNVASSAGFRYFNFGYFAVGITASANNLTGNGGTAAFQDRSPANGQWQLSINETDSANNAALINNLSQLTDIQLQFSIRSYIDQVAAQNCTQ
jgi:hypothetical protein